MRSSFRKVTTTLVVALLAALIAAALPTVTAPAASAGDVNTQVVGGRRAEPGEYPYMAVLVFAPEPDAHRGQWCGGSVIAPDLILTAAHCVHGVPPRFLDVITGQNDLRARDGHRTRVKHVYVHPDFRASRLRNDIAVVQITQPTDATSIDLVGEDEGHLWTPGTPATVTGWGDFTGGWRVYPYELRTVDTPIVEDEACVESYAGLVHGPSMVCAGNLAQGGSGPCHGDSGGPLAVRDDQRFVQVGLVSWGAGCALAGFPAVYTEIAAMLDYLEPFFDGRLRDVPAWLRTSVDWLQANGHAEGFPDLTFRDRLAISRGEVVRMLFRITGPHPPAPRHRFSDVPGWLTQAVNWASSPSSGPAMSGYRDRTFRPDRNITRGELANVLWTVLGRRGGAPPHGLSDVPPWIDGAVSWLVANGISSGFPTGEYRPNANSTRGQTAFQLHNAFGP